MKKIETVAIIDDDDIYRYAAKRTLVSTQRVNTIMTFADGSEALDFFTENILIPENLPDLVFLDLNMPIIDGWQFLEGYSALKEHIKKNITIYVNSSSTNPDDLIQAKNTSEVTDYIIKPLTLEKLNTLLNI